MQKTADADETIQGKMAFEAYCSQHGVTVKNYHADNGIFRANKWVNACSQKGQGLSFAGVNAHHSNGLAERRIRSLQDLARAMLIHQHRQWKMEGQVHLWPYAVRMANDAINETPNMKDSMGRSPLQIFSDSEIQTNVKHWIPFGCPAYVLDSDLQKQQAIHNKWEYRSRVGIYLGRSPNHSRSIGLIMDRATGLVSPQFHVEFDKSFNTVKEDKFDTTWQAKTGLLNFSKMSKKATKKATSSESIYSHKRGLPEQEGVSHNASAKRSRTDPVVSTPEENDRDSPLANPLNLLQQPSNDSQLGNNDSNPKPPSIIEQSSDTAGNPIPPMQKAGTGSVPDSKQSVPNETQNSLPAGNIVKAMLAELSMATADDIEGELFCFKAMFPAYSEEQEQDPLMVYKATSDPDTMYMHEAMRQKDAAEFRKAMQKEWDDQLGNGNFSIVHRSTVPEGATILPAVWQMKRKRDIKTRRVKKYKARLNIDGSRMQKGKHYDQTYAPVAKWSSIRLMLILCALHGWYSRQIDYVLAFPQAPVEREIYMKIPRPFAMQDKRLNTKDYVLKLHRNVYGQKQASRVSVSYTHLTLPTSGVV